jgi:hypothetical protein
MTEAVHRRRWIIGVAKDEVIDWDNDPRVQVSPIPIVTYEYGARDPDDHSRINLHSSYELALDASKWWAIDHKVYRREVTDWEMLDD